jgi:hypothetical protein
LYLKFNTVKPLFYTRDRKISLCLLTRSLYLTWLVLNNEVHRYKKGPEFSVLINEVYLLKRCPLKKSFTVKIFVASMWCYKLCWYCRPVQESLPDSEQPWIYNTVDLQQQYMNWMPYKPEEKPAEFNFVSNSLFILQYCTLQCMKIRMAFDDRHTIKPWFYKMEGT